MAFIGLDGPGNVVQTYFCDFPSYASSYNEKPIIRESATPDYFYICGGYRVDSAYVIKINATVNPPVPVWSYYYSTYHISPTDLIESPYLSDELIVIGRADLPNSGTAVDAFFMKLSSISGAVLTFTAYNKIYDSDEIFTSIEVARSTSNGSDGYILGGKSLFTATPPCGGTCTRPRNVHYTQWMSKLDQNGAMLWSTLIEPANAAVFTGTATGWIGGISPGDAFTRVYERQNQNNGNFEYYGVSNQYCWPTSTFPFFTPHSHTGVFRLDDNGLNTLSPNEFHYDKGPLFNSSSSFYSPQIVGYEVGSGSKDGLRTFSTDSTNHNFTFLKTYFNGVAGCTDQVLDLANIYSGPNVDLTTNIQMGNFSGLCPPPLWQVFSTPISVGPSTICSASSVGTGTNAKASYVKGLSKDFENMLEVFPNPSKGTLKIKNFQNSTDIHSIYIFDLLGKKYDVKFTSQFPDQNVISIDYHSLQLMPGIYILDFSKKDGSSFKLSFIFND